jgi:hypothetical protein
MKHLTDSKKAQKFLANCGIRISDNHALNAVTLINEKTGEMITLWAESDQNIAAGIPGIYVDFDPN